MILNVSNNTDLVRFYNGWLQKRFDDGYFAVETEKLNNIYELNPKNFELVVFQTKDPHNLFEDFEHLDKLKYQSVAMVTLTPYKAEVEPGLNKKQVLEDLVLLGKKYPHRVVWKYSPIIINHEYSEQYHLKKFESLCQKLSGAVRACIVEFVEPFEQPIHACLYSAVVDMDAKAKMLSKMQEIAQKYQITVYAKGTKNSVVKLMRSILLRCGVPKNANIDVFDMGLPNTCKGMCQYCCVGGNKFVGKRTNCMVSSPIMIGEVNKTKKHIKRKIVRLT